MNFIVKLINGDRHVLTPDEYAALLKTGNVACKNTGAFVNLKSVSDAFSEDVAESVEGKPRQLHGVLHDGTRVVKQFGEWFDAVSLDERGKYCVRLDPGYYPEVARDCVPTPEEFERDYRALPTSERLEKMLQTSPAAPRITSGFEPVAALIAPHAYADENA